MKRAATSGRPTPLPCRGATPYVTRHGFGYSVFEHTERGIRSELWVYVAMDAAIKFSVLKVRKRLGATPPTLRYRIRGMGSWRPAAEIEHARDHRNGPE